MQTSSNQQRNCWARHERMEMVIQKQKNGEKIARALNSLLPAVWRERPHSCAQGNTGFIQDYWQIRIAAPTPDQAIQYSHTRPRAQLELGALTGELAGELLVG